MSDEHKTNLPQGWALAKLGKVLPLTYGKALTEKDRDPSGNVPVYGSSGQVGLHTESLTNNPTLIVGRKGTVGAVYYSPIPCWAIDTTYYFESNDPNINLLYFYYLLTSLDLRSLDRSTAVPGLSRDDYSALEVRIAPLAEQQRIVDEIEMQFSRLDEAVKALKRMQTNLQKLRAATLKQACEGKLVPTEAELARQENRKYEPADALLKRILQGRRVRWETDQLAKMQEQGKPPKDDKWKAKYIEPDALDTKDLPELPEGWTWALTQQLGEIQLGRQRSPKNVSKDYPTKYIRAANITETGLDLSDVLEMEFKPEERERYKLEYGDIVLSEASGSPTQVGKPAVWRNELPLCCFQNTVIRIRAVKCDFTYLLYVFKQFYTSGKFAGIAGGVGINHLSANKFSFIEIPLPPLPEQERIVAEVEARFSTIEELQNTVEKSLQRAEGLRQKILQNAFEGKLVEQNPEEEPASVLLERILLERQQGEAELKQERKKRPKNMKQKITERRKIVEVLHESQNPMTPEELFRNAGFNADENEAVEEFYHEIKEAYNSKLIEQEKHNNGEVFLTAKV